MENHHVSWKITIFTSSALSNAALGLRLDQSTHLHWGDAVGSLMSCQQPPWLNTSEKTRENMGKNMGKPRQKLMNLPFLVDMLVYTTHKI